MKFKRSLCVIEAIEPRLLMAVVSVLNNDDAGAGSLRDAISMAQSGDTISLAGRTGTIELASELAIDKNLTINGPGAAALSISGDNASRILKITAGEITVSNITLTSGGGVVDGGAISQSGATLNLDRVVVRDSIATRNGGGIYLTGGGTLNITDSTITSNSVNATGTTEAKGGGIHLDSSTLNLNRSTLSHNIANGADNSASSGTRAWGGAISIIGTSHVSITNSTLARNQSNGGDYTGVSGGFMTRPGDAFGGAIVNNSTGTLNLLNATISQNAVNHGAGLGNAQGWGGGVYFYTSPTGTITNTIVAGNTTSYEVADYLNNYLTSGGNNLIGVVTYGSKLVHGVNGDLVGTSSAPIDPLLSPLADNGGPTQTMALQSGSLAIDSGKESGAPTTDQRGRARAGVVDRGAFEFAPNDAPTFTDIATTAAAAIDSPFTFNIAAADVNNNDLAIAAPTLPSWLTLNDNGDGTATLTGTPAYGDAGENEIVLRVDDGIDHADSSLTVNVFIPRFTNDTQVLTVYGTENDDNIHIWRRGDTVRMIRNGFMKDFTAVESIEVQGLDGNDAITINSGNIPAYVLGGAGNDTLIGYDEPDNFVGGGGKDTLIGGSGDDRLNGHNGDDRLYGGDGNDTLIGGTGSDRCFGEAGNDIFYARDRYIDVLYGQGGINYATYDSNDTLGDDILALT